MNSADKNKDLHPCLIYIDKEGCWFHKGVEMIHREFIRLFYQNMEIDSQGRYIINWNGERCYVEVKNCTLVVDKKASFPDAVTTRGQKHLAELQGLVKKGHRGVMFFLVQRMDADRFTPADHIDPEYGKKLRQAYKNGVEILVYDVVIDLQRIVLGRKIPYQL